MAGRLNYLFSSSYRRRVRANLCQALGPEGEALALRVAAEEGKWLAELPWIWTHDHRQVLAWGQPVGWERVEGLRAEGKGVLVLLPHLGPFEMIGQFAVGKAPFAAMYRRPRQAWLEPIILAGRSRGVGVLAPADLGGVRTLVRALRDKRVVFLLPDQVPGGGEGQWAGFFGRPAYTMTLAARLSAVANTATLVASARRLPRGGGCRIEFFEPPVPLEGDVAARVEAINRGMEWLIRRCPEQYLWSYNRYKVPAGVARPETLEHS